MYYRKTVGYRLFACVNGILMTCIMATVLVPFLHLLSVSFSESSAIVGGKVGLLPVGWSLSSYTRLFHHPSLLGGFRNAAVQTAVGTFLSLFMLTICAYPLSKPIKGRKVFIWLIMITMFFSGGLIPTYMLVKSLHLIDTLWAIVLPFCIMPYYLMIMISFFQSFPDSLEESARMDGLNPIQILFRIVLPLSKAVLAAMSLFLAVYYWNNWFNSMIYLNSTDKYPIMLLVRNIVAGADVAGGPMGTGTDSMSAASLKASVIMITTLPIACMIPFVQKHFAKGVMLGAIKG
ncbi:carbohydrate ABC transporter permease [Paenibacillus sp. NPDC056579]|uniref:carbohydrate ABC transporter permease n=1 Tax=Paenibacillus sp. NPDC056579 TaxID=3345871 RepID=UPI00369F22F6